MLPDTDTDTDTDGEVEQGAGPTPKQEDLRPTFTGVKKQLKKQKKKPTEQGAGPTPKQEDLRPTFTGVKKLPKKPTFTGVQRLVKKQKKNPTLWVYNKKILMVAPDPNLIDPVYPVTDPNLLLSAYKPVRGLIRKFPIRQGDDPAEDTEGCSDG
jgi:hypothetical protein